MNETETSILEHEFPISLSEKMYSDCINLDANVSNETENFYSSTRLYRGN